MRQARTGLPGDRADVTTALPDWHANVGQSISTRHRSLTVREVFGSGHQSGPAACLVAFIRNGDTIDNMVWITFGNRAVVMPLDRATARVACTRDGDAPNGKMHRRHADHLAPMRGAVAQPDHVRHDQSPLATDGESFEAPEVGAFSS